MTSQPKTDNANEAHNDAFWALVRMAAAYDAEAEALSQADADMRPYLACRKLATVAREAANHIGVC